MYGDAKLYMDGDHMMLDMIPTDIYLGTLTHWQYNTWKIVMEGVPALPSGLVNFLIDEKGKVVEMIIDIPNQFFSMSWSSLK